MKSLRVIIAAGGTGGHLWPALSLALALQKIYPDAEFLFVGTGRPAEEKIIDPTGFKRVTLTVSGVKGQGLVGKVRALSQCLASVWRARSLIREFSPDLCFGAGGYVTVPVGLAARLCGVPLVIHEQNSRPGLSNRVLGKIAKLVFLGFKEAAPKFAASKTVVIGNPVRPEITDLHLLKRDFSSPLTILVTGGSQGATALNKVVAPILARLACLKPGLRIIHQAGATDLPWVKNVYQEAGISAQVSEFFSDMAAIYKEAALVIGRAGALTISELTAAGLPSILVPLPTAADDHQTINAQSLSQAGAARVFSERDLLQNHNILEEYLIDLFSNPGKLSDMSLKAKELAHLGVDTKMAELCLKLLENKEHNF